jgi:hypothetical protein
VKLALYALAAMEIIACCFMGRGMWLRRPDIAAYGLGISSAVAAVLIVLGIHS